MPCVHTLGRMTTQMVRTYSELTSISSFKDRFEYLSLNGFVGEVTFGSSRYMNQAFYKSYEWLSVRREIILRDSGFDLGHDDFPINGLILIHHMNPITTKDIENFNEDIVNPEYLISCSKMTHNAIHYGDVSLLPSIPEERYPGDTAPWKVMH